LSLSCSSKYFMLVICSLILSYKCLWALEMTVSVSSLFSLTWSGLSAILLSNWDISYSLSRSTNPMFLADAPFLYKLLYLFIFSAACMLFYFCITSIFFWDLVCALR
jgi:hypothetical protein